MSKRIEQLVQNLHRKFSWYGRSAREQMRKCILLLPEIERERVWEKKGFGSIYEYAAKLAGMSRASVDEGLRVLNRIEDKPALMEVAEKFGVGAVRPVATIATTETSEFWAEKAKEMSQHTLETYVRETRHQELLRAEENSSEKIDLEAKVSPEIAEKLKKLKGDEDWEKLFTDLIEAREKLLQQEAPQATQATSRHIPAEIERYVMNRSRGICEFPRCNKKYTILHHTQRFALEQNHDPQRIIALCISHERMVHLGLVEYEEQKPGTWKIRKQADPSESKYVIDQQVQKYRQKK